MGFTYSNTTDDLYLPQFYDGALALADATPIILDSTRPSVSGVDGTVALIDVWSDPAAHDDGSWLTAQTLGCRTSPRAVAVSGDTMVVGLPWEDRLPAPMSGAAHVYVRDKTGWRLADFIDPPDQTQYGRFGHAVAIDGDTILVSQCDPYPRIAEPGIVYVYVRKGSTWRLQTRLTGDGSTDTRRAFGVSVTISGDTAVVGAPRARIGVKTEAGAVFIFKRSGDSWSQVQRLTAPTVRDDALFGEDTALDHGTLVVGAPMYDTGGDVNAGAAWVYGRSGGVWKIGARLSPGDPHVDDQFGSPLALSGDTVAVSAPKKDDKGAVIVFVRRAGTWRQQAELTTNDRLGDNYGTAVDVSGDVALVGWPGAGPWKRRIGDSGAVYCFVRRGGTWHRRARIGHLEKDGQSGVGIGVAVAGDDLIVLPGTDSDPRRRRNAVRVYRPYIAEAGRPLQVEADRGVLSNDTGPADESLSAELASAPVHGLVDLAADGSFVYTPPVGFVGTDTFTYRARSTSWQSAPATVTVRVDDSTAPLIDIGEIGSRWLSTPVTVVLSASDATRVARVEYRRAAAKRWQRYRSPFKVRRQGTTTFAVRASDKRGNTSKLRFKVRLDSRRPSIQASKKATGRRGGRITISFRIVDPRPGGPWADVTIEAFKGRAAQGSTTLRRQRVNRQLTRRIECFVEPGRYRLVLTARDAAGNRQRRAASSVLIVR